MIISHAHNFIFIKSRKTGGTSVEIALSRYLGPDDIVTAISPEDEALRFSQGGRGAQNCRIDYADYRALDWYKLVTGRLRGDRSAHARYKNHVSARAVCRRLGAARWSDYFSFTIERNPWDKVVSGYYWHYRDNGRRRQLAPDAPSFADYVRSGVSARFSEFQGYTRDGQLIVDRVLRYESLQDELAEVAATLDLPDTPDVDRGSVNAKSGLRPFGDYRDYYTAELRDIVAEQFRNEIALMDYAF